MDIGFYPFKQEFKRRLEPLLPQFKEIDPNWISLSLLPVGLLTAWIYVKAYDHHWLYLIGFIILALRLTISSLDGMVAQHYSKSSVNGALISRLSSEFADIALMLAIASSSSENMDLALWALAIGWATSYLGLIGLSVSKPIQSIGPVSQTDRIIALALCSLLSAFSEPALWMQVFLWWCIFGGLATCSLRLQKQLSD